MPEHKTTPGEKMPRIFRLDTLTSLLGADKVQEIVNQVEQQKRTSASQLTPEALAATKRYTTWLTSRGLQPNHYELERRRRDRLHWMRVVERMIAETQGAARYIHSYIEKVGTSPADTGKNVYVSCPDCRERFLIHGLDIHMSKAHKKRGPHYSKK